MLKNNNLYGLSQSELEEFVLERGYKKFSAKQIFQWIYQKREYTFEGMTNISKPMRADLDNNYRVDLTPVVDRQKSKDGTIKYLFRLEDGQHIEAVKIPEENRLTLCISSQAGCPLGCEFCMTAKLGHKRNLERGEILAQIARVQSDLKPDDRISNLVFMGMGEPFLNYDNVVSAIDIIASILAFGIGNKKITVSTAGFLPGIYRMTEEGRKFNLAVSLNSADPDTRVKLMPITRKYPLDQLRKAVKYFVDRSQRRVTFEYLLLDGLTDKISDARKLVQFVEGIPCKINLINFNATPALPRELRPSTEGNMFRFRDYLYPRTPAVTIRESRGADISAACGQLAGKKS